MISRLILAWRSIWRNKKRTYITLASIIFAVIVATFMRGLQLGSYDKMLYDAIRSSTGHIALMDKSFWDDKTMDNSMEFSEDLKQILDQDQKLEFWVPEILGGCLISVGNNTRGVVVQGVDPDKKDAQIRLREKIVEGDYIQPEDQAVMLGKDLASFLKVGVGDTVVLLGQGYMGITAAGTYPVKGIYDHPMADFNRRLVYLPLAAAQYLFFMDGRVSTVNLVLNDTDDIPGETAFYHSKIDTSSMEVRNWESMNQDMLSAIKSDNFFGKIMIGVLYMVIGFGIFGTILMMTMERKREFSIMMAIGMQDYKLITQVVLESIFIAAIGAIVGLVISFPVVYFYSLHPIPITGESAQMYRDLNMEPILSISTNPGYMLAQFGIVLIISIIASIFPLYNIRKFNIVDIIRGRQ
ncbi:MAG: transporter [Cyclobacteriaceae bacterium]|nr:MAG: transporter [Cyclobacteriaceae bacterium]